MQSNDDLFNIWKQLPSFGQRIARGDVLTPKMAGEMRARIREELCDMRGLSGVHIRSQTRGEAGYSRPLRAGEKVEKTDYYLSTSGTWQPAPCPGATVIESPNVQWARPIRACADDVKMPKGVKEAELRGMLTQAARLGYQEGDQSQLDEAVQSFMRRYWTVDETQTPKVTVREVTKVLEPLFQHYGVKTYNTERFLNRMRYLLPEVQFDGRAKTLFYTSQAGPFETLHALGVLQSNVDTSTYAWEYAVAKHYGMEHLWYLNTQDWGLHLFVDLDGVEEDFETYSDVPFSRIREVAIQSLEDPASDNLFRTLPESIQDQLSF